MTLVLPQESSLSPVMDELAFCTLIATLFTDVNPPQVYPLASSGKFVMSPTSKQW